MIIRSKKDIHDFISFMNIKNPLIAIFSKKQIIKKTNEKENITIFKAMVLAHICICRVDNPC